MSNNIDQLIWHNNNLDDGFAINKFNHILIGHKIAIVNEPWPSVDENALVQNKVQIIVQVNGKLRAKLIIAAPTRLFVNHFLHILIDK
jgi:hypothetical protein